VSSGIPFPRVRGTAGWGNSETLTKISLARVRSRRETWADGAFCNQTVSEAVSLPPTPRPVRSLISAKSTSLPRCCHALTPLPDCSCCLPPRTCGRIGPDRAADRRHGQGSGLRAAHHGAALEDRLQRR